LTRGRRLNLAAIIEKAITGIAGFIIPSEVLQNQPLLLGMDTQLGGGHILHLLCDISIASENAKFGQAGPEVGSFDAGFGASFLARCVGEKKAREIWFLCRQYTAEEALDMGLVNKEPRPQGDVLRCDINKGESEWLIKIWGNG
jgi:hypothetical protein